MRSEVFCTNCSGSFIAELDLSLEGNHQITCPLCGHIHYRVVRGGVVTEERWASSSQMGTVPVYYASTSTTITTNYLYTTSTNVMTSSSWFNRSDLDLVTTNGTS